SRRIVAEPRYAASPLVEWAERTLIDPAAEGRATVIANFAPNASARAADHSAVSEFVLQRQSISRFVRDALQSAVDKQKENADKRGRKNLSTFHTVARVLLSTEGIRSSAVAVLGANKLAPRFIGPFKITKVLGDAYTLDIPSSLRLHPTFYVGRLKRYHPAEIPDPERRATSAEHASNGPHVEPGAPSIHRTQAPAVAGEVFPDVHHESGPPAPGWTDEFAPQSVPPAKQRFQPGQHQPERPAPDSQQGRRLPRQPAPLQPSIDATALRR
ncbi:hypothetical protein F442_20107, partial [Phytophthora nicotianae P10297]